MLTVNMARSVTAATGSTFAVTAAGSLAAPTTVVERDGKNGCSSATQLWCPLECPAKHSSPNFADDGNGNMQMAWRNGTYFLFIKLEDHENHGSTLVLD